MMKLECMLTEVVVFSFLKQISHFVCACNGVQVDSFYFGFNERHPDLVAGGPVRSHHLSGGMCLLLNACGVSQVDMACMERDIIRGIGKGCENIG